jgi:hypothetical protein
MIAPIRWILALELGVLSWHFLGVSFCNIVRHDVEKLPLFSHAPSKTVSGGSASAVLVVLDMARLTGERGGSLDKRADKPQL